MTTRSYGKLLATLLTVGLFAFGCGDDETGGTNGGGNGDDTGTPTDTGMNGDDDTGMEDEDTGNNGDCEACPDDRFTGGETPSCSDSSPPDRCGEDPASFQDFAASSAVTKLRLTSGGATDDCCFDIDGDGENENALGDLLSTLGGLAGLNVDAEIASNIVANEPFDDDLVLLVEHQGLSELGQSDPFMMNFFLGDYGNQEAQTYLTKDDDSCSFSDLEQGDELCATTSMTGKQFTVDPATLDEGVHPQAQVPDATLDGSSVDAGPGTVIVDISSDTLGDISLTINGATIEGTVDGENSDLSDGGDGVVIEEGRLGGYVLAKDLLGLVDSLLSDCNCLDLGDGENAITFPTQGDDSETDLQPPSCGENSGEECRIGCTQAVQEATSMDACSGAEGVCGFAGTICGQLSILTGGADLDIDGDGTNDAFSAGALIEATGANITGVTTESGTGGGG